MFKGTNVLFRDITLLMVSGLVVLLLIVLPHLNPVKDFDDTEIDSPGDIIVEMFWPYEQAVDIDLWMKTPAGEKAIHYNFKSNQTTSLLRDDRGWINDAFERNDEIAFVRGLQDGEYVVNIHFFGPNVAWNGTSILVKTRVTLRKEDSVRVLYSGEDVLEYSGEEKTVYRFTIEDGVVTQEGTAPMVLARKYLSGRTSRGGGFASP